MAALIDCAIDEPEISKYLKTAIDFLGTAGIHLAAHRRTPLCYPQTWTSIRPNSSVVSDLTEVYFQLFRTETKLMNVLSCNRVFGCMKDYPFSARRFRV